MPDRKPTRYDIVNEEIERQERQREKWAHDKGKARKDKIDAYVEGEDEKSTLPEGGPASDGYGKMKPNEREAYKKGYTGG